MVEYMMNWRGFERKRLWPKHIPGWHGENHKYPESEYPMSHPRLESSAF
jgi:hypothetical protein